MSSDTVQRSVSSFQYQPQAEGGCSWPIHQNREREPFTAPLGLPFAEHVSAEPIPAEMAARIYDAHHAYMSDVPDINMTHHGVFFQDNIVGSITYRPPLGTRKLHYGDEGRLLPRPHSESDIQDLPAELRPTARRIVPLVDGDEVHATDVVGGRSIVEVARICIGVDMANLASAALARSQERFAQSEACKEETRYLLTFVRADYNASMIRALRDKGWVCTGWSSPSQAGNREQRPIRDRYKWRFLCPIEWVQSQTGLEDWMYSNSN